LIVGATIVSRHRGLASCLALGFGSLALLAAVTIAFAPAAQATTIDVPNFNQLTLNTAALRASGCDATCLTMVGAYYGSGRGLQDSINALLQAGMIASNGYVNRYTGLSQVLGGTATWYAQSPNATNLSLITAQLDAGYPVIVWIYVANGTNTHWVVLTGHSGGTYYMNDPDGGAKNANFNTTYGGPAAIQGYVIYHGAAGSPPSTALPSGWISGAVVNGTAPGSIATGSRGWTAVSFGVTAGPWNVNIRSNATTSSGIVGTLPANASVTCSGWEDGQSVANAWSGTPEQRWYRIGAAPDTKAPTTTVSGLPAGWTDHAVTLAFAATDNQSGVAYTEHQVGGGAWLHGGSATVSTQGTTTIFYRSVDVAGNTEKARSCTVRIDTRRPKVVANWAATVTSGHTAGLLYCISDPRPGSPTATVTIRVRTSTGRLAKKLVVGAVAVDTRLAAKFVCKLTPGQYRFSIYATDAAGNTQVSVSSNRLTVK
jgi:uncharacterized protein YvpB